MTAEHQTEIRVSYSQTDQMGVVYYAHYLVWFEIARTDFFRSRGFDYRTIEEKRGLALPVIDVQCTYKSPARYDDLIIIKTKFTSAKHTSLTASYEVVHKASCKLLATGKTSHVFIDITTRKPVKIPEDIREALLR